LCFAANVFLPRAHAQEPAKPSTEKAATPAAPENPAQIELLETKIRFETNGDSRKEVHARVRINSELGVRQFARLNFDYNRSFESIDIPLVRITHPSGGTADILSSAITDNPNPAVVNAPAYHDVRVKSVRILGLQPGDLLEYRVITLTSHHPLAPDFWLDHTFDRTGVVSREIFDLDLPSASSVQLRVSPGVPAATLSGDVGGLPFATLKSYHWDRTNPAATTAEGQERPEPDIAASTIGWESLSIRMDEKLSPGVKSLEKIDNHEEPGRELSHGRDVTSEIAAKAIELTKVTQTNKRKLEAIYDFVSQKIATIDLPLGATGFVGRSPNDVLASGYATSEDKFVLFAALAAALKLDAKAALTGYCDTKGLPRPSVFKRLLISASNGKSSFWLDPSLEVAPFGVILGNSGKCAFILNRAFFPMNSTGQEWQQLTPRPPFPSKQRVTVTAALSNEGKLSAKVHYSMRGENELLLRVAFHQSPPDKWKDIAQLLSLSDGFRGQVTGVTASDPYATREPFTVDYEIAMPKFVDWSKKTVHVPALLPQVGLPDPRAKPATGAKPPPIELGTPLEVTTSMTLQLPPGTKIQPPTGTSVQRDYAAFASQYSAKGQTITASRHINFILSQIPAGRAADYNAFLRAVQNDEAQDFILDREAPTSKPATRP
jgi:hypothetical protein